MRPPNRQSPGVSHPTKSKAKDSIGQIPDEKQFFRRPPDRRNFRHYEGLPDLAMRSGKWKFYCDYDGGRPLLFDLISDPAETNSLVGEERDQVESMKIDLLQWHQSMPADNGPALSKEGFRKIK